MAISPIATVAISSLPAIIEQLGKFIVSMRERKAKRVGLEEKLEELAMLVQESAIAQTALEARIASLESRLARAESEIERQARPWWKRR